MSPAQTVDESAKQQTPDGQMERLALYLLQELQIEIDHGNKGADQARYRAFKRLEVEK